MPSQMTSHPLSLLVIFACLVVMAAPLRRKIDCTRYVFHPACRGIAAKRSSSSSYSSPSSSSSTSSLSSSSSTSSSSSPRLTDDFIKRLMLLTNRDDDRVEEDEAPEKDDDVESPSSHHQKEQRQQELEQNQQRRQQQQEQLLRHRVPLRQQYYRDREDSPMYSQNDQEDRPDKEDQWRRTLMRVLLMELAGSKDYGGQTFYGYYPEFDNVDTT